jgi:NADH:ubiquinone oxidoreductase subunit 5 (subunit L)/multisubunit Na+/H+ antiporter MnhA subunit
MLSLVWINFFLSLITLCFGRFFNRIDIIKVWVVVVGGGCLYARRKVFQLITGGGSGIDFSGVGNLFNYGLWFQVSEIAVEWRFSVDGISVIIAWVVVFVSSGVQLYALHYLWEDPHIVRFRGCISLFTAFRLLLVHSRNLFVFMVGWEGIGLCSFLLISFWSTRVRAVKAAFKAVLINKIGDIGLLRGVVLCVVVYGSVDFDILNLSVEMGSGGINVIIFIFFLCRVIRKSAQIGLHTWLTDAIEGPTPVSALLHAATMVTAGVFLVMRLNGFFSGTGEVGALILALVGIGTVRISGVLARRETDVKKIIALSTANHLGVRLILCSLGAYAGRFFHLVNHAFRKALLFRCRGLLIHLNGDNQLSRFIRANKIAQPFVFRCAFLSIFSLFGGVFTAGFCSKEVVFVLSTCEVSVSAFFLSIFFMVMTSFVVSVYSVRLLEGFANCEGWGEKMLNVSRRVVVGVYKNKRVGWGVEVLLFGFVVIALRSGVRLYDYVWRELGGRNFQTASTMSVYEMRPWFIKFLPIGLRVVGVISVRFFDRRIVGWDYFYNYRWAMEFMNNNFIVRCFKGNYKRVEVVEKGWLSVFVGTVTWHRRFGGFRRKIIGLYTGSVYNLFAMIFFFCCICCICRWLRWNGRVGARQVFF